jgi:spermidine/putrescine transport system substrate-binding protein
MPATSRRSFVRAALAGCTSALVSACTAITPTPASEGVDPAQLGRSMKMLLWSETISNSVVQKFKTAFGLNVFLDVVGSNEEIARTLRSDPKHGYDLIVAGDYMVAELIASGLLQPLKAEQIPNSKHIAERNRSLYYDADNAYSRPYFWGVTGVLYNPERLPGGITSWSQLLTPTATLTGRIGMLNDARELVAMALRVGGASGSSTNEAELATAQARLLRQREFVASYDAPQTNSQRVLTGELDAAMVRTHNAMAARREKPELRFVLPDPVCSVWQHNFLIPKAAPSPYTAATFINFMLRPEIAAENSRAIGAASPNQTALSRGLLDPAQVSDPTVYPDLINTNGRFEWLVNLTAAQTARYDAILAAVTRP